MAAASSMPKLAPTMIASQLRLGTGSAFTTGAHLCFRLTCVISPRGIPRGEITQVSRKQRCAPVVNAEPVPNRSWDAIMVGASFGMELAAAIELAGAEKRYDLRSRFARVHLSTRAERAVYLVLVCDRTRAWSAEEIARLKDVEQ